MKLERRRSVDLKPESDGQNGPETESSHKPEVQSQQVLANSSLRKRQKVPTSIKSSLRLSVISGLREKSSVSGEQKSEQHPSKPSFKVTSAIKKKIKDFRHITNCEICETEFKINENITSLCQCKHRNFCQSCLHHYVIYKVNNFEEVYCPHETCEALIDTQINFFRHLPLQIQQKYYKVHQFNETVKDPNKKLCPKEKCNGVIHAMPDQVMVCDRCEAEYCGICLLPVHEGDCDQREVKQFEKNLRYRQCKQCRFVVQRIEGCNHMRCRCGKHFCYVCGADWDPVHNNNHDTDGNVIQPGLGPQNINARCQCTQLNEACGPFSEIIKFPLKITLTVLFLGTILPFFAIVDILLILAQIFMCIIIGIFGSSCQLLSNCCDGPAILIGVACFPFFILGAIGLNFQKTFCRNQIHQLFYQQGIFCVEVMKNIWAM